MVADCVFAKSKTFSYLCMIQSFMAAEQEYLFLLGGKAVDGLLDKIPDFLAGNIILSLEGHRKALFFPQLVQD